MWSGPSIANPQSSTRNSRSLPLMYLALPNRCTGSLVVPLFFLSNRFENSRQEKFIFYMFIARDCLVRCRYLDFRGITFSQVLI
jgi:hypothetical protein